MTGEEVPMTSPAKRPLSWAPRVLCIAFAALIGVFALDVFQEGVPAGQIPLALLVHLLPTLLVLLALALSRRREWFGGALFSALGFLYLLWARSRLFFGWVAVLSIAAPLVLWSSCSAPRA